MRQLFFAIIFILAAAMTISGCSSVNRNEPNTSDVPPRRDLFEYEKENLKVKFDTPVTPENIPTRVRIKEKHFDEDMVKALFLGGNTIDASQSGGTYYITENGTSLDFNDKMSGFRFYDGTSCRDGIDSGTAENAPLNFRLYLRYGREQYRDIYGIGEALKDLSSQNAIDKALELCSALGIKDLGEPEIYAFDKAVYDKLKETDSSWINKAVPFTAEYEAYILRFPQVFGGISLADIAYVTVSGDDDNNADEHIGSSEVVVGVSKNGIFHFGAEEIYEPEYEALSSEPIKFSFDHALMEFKNYIERIYFTSETRYTSADIIYFPIKRTEAGYVEFAAAWRFRGSAKNFASSDARSNCDTVFLTENGERKDYTNTVL